MPTSKPEKPCHVTIFDKHPFLSLKSQFNWQQLLEHKTKVDVKKAITIMGILVDVDTEHNIKSMMGIIVSVVNNFTSHIYTEWLLWWLIIASRVLMLSTRLRPR